MVDGLGVNKGGSRLKTVAEVVDDGTGVGKKVGLSFIITSGTGCWSLLNCSIPSSDVLGKIIIINSHYIYSIFVD